jgi:DNA-binding MarR family transcriptional regulator
MSTPCFCTNLRLATRKLSAIYDAALEPFGINIAQYFLLRTIGQHEAVSFTELARLVELERSTVGRNVRVLERMGLLETTRSDADQRETLVSLTGAGDRLMQGALPVWVQCQQAFIARLGDDKVGAFASALQAI